MTDREKLIKLIEHHCDYAGNVDCKGNCEHCLADHLIANGVTFAADNNVGSKWIPVTERLPQEFVSVLVCIPCEHPFPTVKEAYLTNDYWVTKTSIFSDKDVTHWMPLPEPPKEETP